MIFFNYLGHITKIIFYKKIKKLEYSISCQIMFDKRFMQIFYLRSFFINFVGFFNSGKASFMKKNLKKIKNIILKVLFKIKISFLALI